METPFMGSPRSINRLLGSKDNFNKEHKSRLRMRRQQLYNQQDQRDIKHRPLNEFALYTLNDKLENINEQDSEDAFIDQIQLNFVKPQNQKQFSKNNRSKSAMQLDNSQMFIAHADGYSKLMWDFFCMLLIVYEIVIIPFKLSFDGEVNSTLDSIIDIIFMLDIVITFNTSIYHKGIPVFDRKKIMLSYLQMWFWIDLVASFPYDTVVDWATAQEIQEEQSDQPNSTTKYAQTVGLLKLVRFMRFIKIIRLLRLAKLKVIFDKFEEFLQFSVMISTIFSFIKLSLFVLFWSHWLGCIFHYIAVNEDSQDNWLYINGLYDEPWSTKYINALYWGVTTMNTVGYGDLSPQTTTERLFGIFFLMVATVVFSVAMNSIGSSLSDIEDKTREIKHKLNQVVKYMKKQQINNELQNRIRRYLSYVMEQEAAFNFEHMTDQLSYSLRYEFEIQVNGANIGICDPLKSNFSTTFLTQVTKTFKQLTAYPDSFIVQESTVYEDRHLYFIQNGSVNLVLQKNSQIILKLEKLDYFGELEFFTDMERYISAQSVNFTNLLYIDKSEFLTLIKSFQSDHQIFCQIKDDINFQQNYASIQVICYGCMKDDHILKYCPNLHYIIEQPLYSQLQKKSQTLFDRKDRIDYNALANNGQIKLAVLQISSLARKIMLQQDECNLNDSAIEPSEGSGFLKNTKPPRFGPFRSRFREDRAKYRKMKSYIQDQDSKIKGMQSQQNITEMILKQLTIINTKQQRKSDDQSALVMAQLRRATKDLTVKSFKKRDSVASVLPIDTNEFHQVTESDKEKDKSFADYQTSNYLLDLFNEYFENQREKEKEMNQIKENTFYVIDGFDKAADFESYYKKYNKETMIDEYNRIQKGHQFRAVHHVYFENEVLRSALQQYKSLFEAKSKAVFRRRNMLSRTIKLSRGLIKTAMSQSIEKQQKMPIAN